MEEKSLKEILEDSGFEPYSYSGRFMYGKKCVAINVENPLTTMVEIFEAIIEEVLPDNEMHYNISELISDLKNTKQDSMGLGMVLYWPDVEWIND